VLLFHHDPMHGDRTLDRFGARARDRWRTLGGRPGSVSLAHEGEELMLGARLARPRRAVGAPARHPAGATVTAA